MTLLPGAAVRTAQRPMPAVGAAEVIRDLDLGKYLFWQDTLWTDADGNSVATAPFAQVLPSLSGTPRVGQAVTCAPGSWAGFPVPTPTYQWTRDGQSISGATASSYTPVAADLNRILGCNVTGTNTAGTRTATAAAVVQAAASLITVTPNTFTANSAPGTVVATLSGLAPGATVGLIDNGGRVVLNADATALVAGNVRTPAGTLFITLVITPADGRSPQLLTVSLVVTASGGTTPVPLSISGTPGAATVGSPYTFTPTVSGGSGTRSFSLTGTLPAGGSFSSTTGTISGPFTTAGTASGLAITVTDATGSVPLAGLSIVVSAAAAALQALALSASSATVGTAYTGTISNATGGSSIDVSGAGSPGLSVSGTGTTRTLSGTPSATGAVNLVETLSGATGSPRTTSGLLTVVAAAAPVLAKSLGSGTASGVSFAQLPSGASFTNPGTAPASYFTISGGLVSTNDAFVSAALGTTTLDVAITNGGGVTTLRVSVVAGQVDYDTGATMKSAIDAAPAGTDSTIYLTDTFADGAALIINKVFSGTISHPNKGITVEQSIADPTLVKQGVSPTMSGGSMTVMARTPSVPRFNNKLTLQGCGPIAFDGIAARLSPTQDVYNAKFNEVTQSVLWKPSVNATGSTGRSRAVSSSSPTVFTQIGHGQAVGDVMSFTVPTSTVTITNASPAVVTWNSHGFQPGDAVFFTVSTGGALPAGMATGAQTSGTVYTVRAVNDANSFTLSKPDGTELATTSAGSGTFTGTVRLPTGFAAGTQYNIATIPSADSYTLALYKGGPGIVGVGGNSPVNATFVASGVNGLSVMDRTGIGYLASTAERRVYIATKASGAGSGFQGYFDANDDGTIDASSPLYIERPGTGYTTATQFRQPTLGETTQLTTCQSNTLPASSTVQIQVSANGTVLPKVILRNGSSGNPGGSINRIGHCLDVRNAEQLYVHDWTFDRYWLAIQVYYANDCEFARIFSKGNANDFYRQYPSTGPIGSQATTGPNVRVVAPVCVSPLAFIDHSNEHADAIQIGTPSDLTQKHNLIFRFGRIFWPGNIREHQTQAILNTQGPIPYIHDISDNFFMTSTQNAQLGSCFDPAKSQYNRNTYFRYMENNPSENEFSPGYPSCIEPWFIPKDVYSATKEYNYGHVVSDGASPPNLYISKYVLGAHTNQSLTNTTYWAPFTGYDITFNDNIAGAIWDCVPNASVTALVTKTLVYSNPTGGVYSSPASGGFPAGAYKYHAAGNRFISNYTANTGAGTSMPEVLTGGTTFFDNYAGSDIGWTGFKNKIPVTSYADARNAIDAAFSTKASGHTAIGKGYLQEGGLPTYGAPPSSASVFSAGTWSDTATWSDTDAWVD